jgi:hypothetical protein
LVAGAGGDRRGRAHREVIQQPLNYPHDPNKINDLRYRTPILSILQALRVQRFAKPIDTVSWLYTLSARVEWFNALKETDMPYDTERVTAAAWAEYARALSNRVELTTRKENDMKHEISVDDIPGTVRQVWGGWVWVLPGEYELAWTKRRSEESCTTVVLDYVRREGVDALSDDAG